MTASHSVHLPAKRASVSRSRAAFKRKRPEEFRLIGSQSFCVQPESIVPIWKKHFDERQFQPTSLEEPLDPILPDALYSLYWPVGPMTFRRDDSLNTPRSHRFRIRNYRARRRQTGRRLRVMCCPSASNRTPPNAPKTIHHRLTLKTARKSTVLFGRRGDGNVYSESRG